MTCEIINRIPYYVNIFIGDGWQIAAPDENVFVRFDGGILDVSLSYRMNSFRNEIGFEKRSVDGFFRRLTAKFDKNTNFQYSVVIDSEFVFYGVSDGERFTIVNLENDLTTQDRCRAPNLMRERGDGPRKHFAPRKDDEIVAQYRKENRSACRKLLAIQLLFSEIIDFFALILLFIIIGGLDGWQGIGTEDWIFWGGLLIVLAFVQFGGPIREYIRDTKHDFIAVFCRNFTK